MPTQRPSLALGILVCVMLALTGCDGSGVPAPAPAVPTPSYHATPSDTAATDADVADAAAALDAYTEASNVIDWADPASVERFYSFSTGKQNELDRRDYGELLDAGWRVEGAVRFTVVGVAPGDHVGQMKLAICAATDDLRFFDASGVEQYRPNATPVAERTAVVSRGADGRWRVSELIRRGEGPQC